MNTSITIISSIYKVNAVLTKGQKKTIAALLLMMLVSALTETFGISLVIPYFSVLTDPDKFMAGKTGSFLLRSLRLSDRNDVLIFLTIVLIVAFGLKYMLTYIIRLKQTGFINNNRLVMAQRLMSCLLRENYERHQNRNISEEINLVTTHVTWTFDLIGAVLTMTIQVLTVISLSAFMLTVDFTLTLLFGAGISMIFFLFNKAFKSKVVLAGKEANLTWEEYEKTIAESFLLKKENVVFSRNNQVFDSFLSFGKRNIMADYKKTKYGIIPGLVTNLIGVWAVLFYVLFSLSAGNEIIDSIGKLSAFYLAVTRIIPGVNTIFASAQVVSFYNPSLERVKQVLADSDKSVYTEGLNFHVCTVHNSIMLKDVSFRYNNSSTNVLDRINLSIMHGERIGIVGKTGSGKTTLVNLIIGLLRPTSGNMTVDDAKMACDSIINVGYVPQDTNLLETTIRENIVFGRNVNDDELEKVMDAAGLREFVRQLPQGLDTEVGALGMKLSGGQRQRIGIARALIGSPSVLVFDESTSSLDIKTEMEIVNTIKNLERDKMVIIISHRPGTLQFCDRWFRMKDHRIYESSVCP